MDSIASAGTVDRDGGGDGDYNGDYGGFGGGDDDESDGGVDGGQVCLRAFVCI